MAKYWSNSVKVYFGPYDFGTATTSIGITKAVAVLDPTTLGEAAERGTAGIKIDTVDWAGLFDDSLSADAGGSLLIGSSTNNVYTVIIGSATGSVAYAGTGLLLKAKVVTGVKDLVRQEVSFTIDQALDRCQTYFAKSTATATGTNNTGPIDNAASSTGSGTMYAHVFSITGSVSTGTTIIFFQHSSDTVTWVSMGTAIFTATGAQRVSFAGSILRYTRGQSTLSTAGTAVYAMVGKRE